MILVVGIDDGIIDHFLNYLSRSNKKYHYIDQSKIGGSIQVSKNKITIDNIDIKPNTISGVYLRLAAPDRCKKRNSPNHEINTQILIEHLQLNYKNIINPICSGISNSSKPYQLSTLNLNHLRIPETYILANCPYDFFIKYFHRKSNYIFKSISSYRSIVHKLEEHLPIPITNPMQIQEYLGLENYRVHVIGKYVFPMAILESQTVDYRYSPHIKLLPIQLPNEIIKECIEITKQLDLVFSGIDLIKKNNNYFLLEVNPQPAFSMYEQCLQYKFTLCEALYEALIT